MRGGDEVRVSQKCLDEQLGMVKFIKTFFTGSLRPFHEHKGLLSVLRFLFFKSQTSPHFWGSLILA